MNVSQDELNALLKRTRDRAHSSRRFARWGIAAIIVIVGSMVAFFYQGAQPISVYFASDMPVHPQAFNSNPTDEEIAQWSQDFDELTEEFQRLRERVEMQGTMQENLLSRVTGIIIQIASVALAVYLIGILVSFTRYHFQIAEHLDSSADALQLSKGDPDQFNALMHALTTNQIEFGKIPTTPHERGIELLSKLTDKIPDNK